MGREMNGETVKGTWASNGCGPDDHSVICISAMSLKVKTDSRCTLRKMYYDLNSGVRKMVNDRWFNTRDCWKTANRQTMWLVSGPSLVDHARGALSTPRIPTVVKPLNIIVHPSSDHCFYIKYLDNSSSYNLCSSRYGYSMDHML